jgi:tRNA-dihydrouridine synthase
MVSERGGVGLVCTEFVRIGHSPISPRALARQVVKAPGVPLCVQVMGNDDEKMAEAAEKVAEAGADVVDVNLGCPMPRIVKKGVGAALLKDLPRLSRLLGAMRKRLPGLLSAKIRAGFDDASEVLAIARTVEESGVDYLVIHPRRRVDRLNGVADWRSIRLVKEAVAIPVVGNGDCWYAADAPRMRAETGCDAVMIGRPALRNPWIFRQIAELEAGIIPFAPSGADLAQAFEAALASYQEAFGRRAIGMLKEMLTYLGRALPDDRAFSRAVLRLQDLDAIRALTRRTLEPLSSDQLDLRADGHLQLERSGRI